LVIGRSASAGSDGGCGGRLTRAVHGGVYKPFQMFTILTDVE
jgi:hypothetical protein